MKRFFGFYKNRYQISTKNEKPLMNIKTEEKTIGAKKNFWTPLSEKTGARKEKNAKNDQF